MHVRLAAWYAVSMGALACVPFLAVVLADTGVTPSRIAAILALLPLGMLVGGPLWAWVADVTGRERWVFRAAVIGQALAGTLLAVAHDAATIGLAILLFAVARSPQSAIADALTVRHAGNDYGRFRAAGSLAYLIVAFANGLLREQWPHSPVVVGAALMWVSVLVTWSLPSGERERSRGLSDVKALLTHPALLPFVAVAFLHGLTITTYDNLFSLHIEQLGLPSRMLGTAIAIGVGVEVFVLAAGGRLLERFGPQRLALFAVACGVPRWLLTGMFDDPVVLVGVQALHGVMFGCFWVAGVALMSQLAPKGMSRSAQALLPATMFGAGYLTSMLIATAVLDEVGTAVLFQGMSAVSAAALVVGALTVRPRDR